jgi:hypothetical protein
LLPKKCAPGYDFAIILTKKVKLSLHLLTAHEKVGAKTKFLTLALHKSRKVVIFMLQPFYPQGKSPQFPLDRKLDEPQSQYGHGNKKNNFYSFL